MIYQKMSPDDFNLDDIQIPNTPPPSPPKSPEQKKTEITWQQMIMELPQVTVSKPIDINKVKKVNL